MYNSSIILNKNNKKIHKIIFNYKNVINELNILELILIINDIKYKESFLLLNNIYYNQLRILIDYYIWKKNKIKITNLINLLIIYSIKNNSKFKKIFISLDLSIKLLLFKNYALINKFQNQKTHYSILNNSWISPEKKYLFIPINYSIKYKKFNNLMKYFIKDAYQYNFINIIYLIELSKNKTYSELEEDALFCKNKRLKFIQNYNKYFKIANKEEYFFNYIDEYPDNLIIKIINKAIFNFNVINNIFLKSSNKIKQKFYKNIIYLSIILINQYNLNYKYYIILNIVRHIYRTIEIGIFYFYKNKILYFINNYIIKKYYFIGKIICESFSKYLKNITLKVLNTFIKKINKYNYIDQKLILGLFKKHRLFFMGSINKSIKKFIFFDSFKQIIISIELIKKILFKINFLNNKINNVKLFNTWICNILIYKNISIFLPLNLFKLNIIYNNFFNKNKMKLKKNAKKYILKKLCNITKSIQLPFYYTNHDIFNETNNYFIKNIMILEKDFIKIQKKDINIFQITSIYI